MGDAGYLDDASGMGYAFSCVVLQTLSAFSAMPTAVVWGIKGFYGGACGYGREDAESDIAALAERETRGRHVYGYVCDWRSEFGVREVTNNMKI